MMTSHDTQNIFSQERLSVQMKTDVEIVMVKYDVILYFCFLELCKMSLAGDLVIRFALVFLIYSSSTICRKTNKKRLAKRNDFPR